LLIHRVVKSDSVYNGEEGNLSSPKRFVRSSADWDIIVDANGLSAPAIAATDAAEVADYLLANGATRGEFVRLLFISKDM
jgi:hypothetical protein